MRVGLVADAIAAGHIAAPEPWIEDSADQPAEVAGLLAIQDGHCVFHQPVAERLVPEVGRGVDRGRRCAIHTARGSAALPVACQHFPRVCLIDDRGVFVTLSHYCPTAAALLASHRGPIDIVSGPDPIPDGRPEGLDARGAWPPLLAPGRLMDLTSYDAWEAHVVSWLGGGRNPDGHWLPEQAVALIDRQARALSAWRPGHGALFDAVMALADERPDERDVDPPWSDERGLREAARRALSAPTAHTALDEREDFKAAWTPEIAAAWALQAPVVNRLLASHAFASWLAYQGNGLVSHARALRLTLAVLRSEVLRICRRDGATLTAPRLLDAVRQTDLLIRHLADRDALVKTCNL